MIPEFKHLIIYVLCIISINCACSADKEISINETDAEMFLYDSPITALTDAGDSLLLGTARGDVVSFSLVNGTFHHLFHDEEGRYIYKILKADDAYLYSVQDGGIKLILADGRVHRYPLNSYKESNYSAYDIIYSDGNIYAATSNGVYYWSEPDQYGKRLDESIQKDLNDAVLSRFYSIQKSEDKADAFICAGEAGLYSFSTSGDAECLRSFAIFSNHDGIMLSRNRKVYKHGVHLTQVGIPALDFVCTDKYLYAMSMYAIEIRNMSEGKHVLTINLPERKSLYKNESCRSFSLIKDGYIYVAPGGCTLYRVPVYEHMTDSREVVQVCAAGKGSTFILTIENDLYRYDIGDSSTDYRRSFDESEEVKLIGAGKDYLIVTIDGVYYELTGKRFTDKRFLSDLNRLNKSKVLWHLHNGEHLYQGQVDRIREYSRAKGWNLSQEFEQLDYPKLAALYDEKLIVNTLHDGSYLLNNGRFEKLDGVSDSMIKDVHAADDMICALTDTSISIKGLTMNKDNQHLNMKMNASYKHLTDILVLNDREFMAFSTYNRWCKGFVVYTEREDLSWEPSRHLMTHVINDAASVGDKIVAGGTMGIGVIYPGGKVSIIDVPAPTFLEKHVLAWRYPWGIVIYVTLLLVLLAILVWLIILGRRYYLKHKIKKMAADFLNWVEGKYEGKYVRSLGKNLIKASADCKSLSANIKMFKGMKPELDKWDTYVNDVVKLYEKVKSLKAQDIELDNRDKIKELKERLEYFCSTDHPFGSSIIKEWDKKTSQPVRTLMLLPLKFKIKFMQVFDSRTGTEKMDFKAFMDANKARIQGRKLEIRDLIALSAYEVIISEKGPADA